MLTFTYLSTSKITSWFMAFFLAFSACEKGGDVLFFTAVSWVTTFSGSASLASWPSSAALGNGLFELFTTSQCDNCLDLIHPGI